MTPSIQSSRSAASHLIQFPSDGVMALHRFFAGTDVEDLKAGWSSLKRRIVEGVIARDARFVSGELPEPLGSLYRHAALVNTAQILLGTEDVALYMNRVLLKDAEWSGPVAAHQDMPYFSGGTEKLSMFIPLAPTAARNGNGGLIFVKGSHRFGNLQRGTIRREIFPPMDDLAPDLDVGDIVLMNFLTWHYSEEAAAPADRPLLQIVYQPACDGSYGSVKLGVPKPTLVSGQWQTEHFAAWGESTIPDV